MQHTSVLLKEVLENLNPQEGETLVDATLGSAGHSIALSKILGEKGLIIGIDADKERAQKSEEKLEKESTSKFKVVNKNFRKIEEILDKLGIKKVDKILFDLGLNSEQLESSGKGFSFQKKEPLIMSFGDNPELTAREIVNEWAEESLADVIYGFGGEKFSREIAKKIVEGRKKKPLETTMDLVEIIRSAVPSWYRNGRLNPATKTFQAIRIAVNQELEAQGEGLEGGFKRLRSGGRMAVISFHELEDRLTKRYFRELKKEGLVTVITKKPIVPTREEILENPRARSAKLRVIEKI